uniref:hypothetical protein n=1 Tax=Nonomuraea sp. CA-252377 TaxID=3240003 RepID=UPI003F4960E5
MQTAPSASSARRQAPPPRLPAPASTTSTSADRPACRGRPDQRPTTSRPPRVLPPQPDLKADQLPKICRQHTITLHSGHLGHLDKFRQDLAYLSSAWTETYKPVRANTEGINGRLKGHDLDLGDPKNRLAHGRVAQTILVALLVTVANDHFLDAWRYTHQLQNEPITPADTPPTPVEPFDGTPPAGQSRPPPAP